MDAVLFWILAISSLLGALSVLLNPNPIYSALSLAFTMVSVAALFAKLGAPFVAGVQLIVYAGAVMVLFVMVLMLFDLKHEKRAFSQGVVSAFLKLIGVGMFGGFVLGTLYINHLLPFEADEGLMAEASAHGQSLARVLFTKHVFSFEALGVLLLIIAIGAVALARTKGGTHGK